MESISRDFEFEALAAAQDEGRFCELADGIDWAVHAPDDLITRLASDRPGPG